MKNSGICRYLECLVVLCMAIIAPPNAFAEFRMSVPTKNGVSISVKSVHETAPKFGVAPFDIRISNNTWFDGSWNFTAQVQSWGVAEYRMTETLEVPAGETKSFTVFVDIFKPGAQVKNFYPHVQFFVTGPGISSTSHSLPMTQSLAYRKPPKEYAPKALFSPHLSAFQQEMKDLLVPPKPSYKKTNETQLESLITDLGMAANFVFFGNTAELDSLPSDWRGYLGFRQVWITKDEFNELPLSKKESLRAWAFQGGVLFLVTKDRRGAGLIEGDRTLGSKTEVRDKVIARGHVVKEHGLGTIVSIATGGSGLTLDDFAPWIHLTTAKKEPVFYTEEAATKATWDLIEIAGNEASILAGPVALVLIVYAFLLGPIAVMVIGKRRPMSLYFTIPTLATVATTILVAMILLQYGTGAEGERQLAVLIEPEDRIQYTLQEQSTRNGIIFNSSFVLPDDTLMRLVSLGEKRTSGSFIWSLSGKGKKYNGDFYPDRKVTGHVLLQLKPSRSRIDLIRTENGITLASSLPTELKTVQYVDLDGTVWIGENLRQGGMVKLRRATLGVHSAFMRNVSNEFATAVSSFISDVQGRQGYFFGWSETADAFALPSLDVIRWGTTPGLIVGAVEESRGIARRGGS